MSYLLTNDTSVCRKNNSDLEDIDLGITNGYLYHLFISLKALECISIVTYIVL